MPSFKDTNNVIYTSRDIADKLINTQLSGVQGQDLVLIRRQNTSQTGSVLMSNILNRATHTGTQAISTIDNLQQTLDSKITNIYTQQGSLIKSNSLNQPEELKIGTIGQILTSDGTNPLWLNIPISSESSQGIITIANQVETDTGTNDEKAITPLKLRNSSLATTTQKGVTQLATQTEYFNKDNAKAITANNVYNDVRLAKFSVSNSATGLTQVVATGGSYNLLTPLSEANEAQLGNIPIVYKNTANVVQNKILDEANDKFLFPSNLNTFNLSYTSYLIRVVFTVNIPALPNDSSTEFAIAIRRVIDNSEVASVTFFKTTGAAVTNKQYTGFLKTFVNSETDPYVLDGCSLFIENSAGSQTAVTLTSANIRIFRD